MTERRVIVLGDVMLDVLVRPLDRAVAASDTPARVAFRRGGASANLAVALAETGHRVAFVGAGGEDVPGRLFGTELIASGVELLVEMVAAPTGVVVVLVADDGQRSMMTDRGANRLLSAQHVRGQLERPFDHLHVSGYTLLDGATRELARAALRAASERGATTSVDVCSTGPLARVTPALFLDLARGATMLFANEAEALALSETANPLDAIAALAPHFDEVVVTLGAAGALASAAGTITSAPALGHEVLDTTGAGDAATGTYLGARLQGRDVARALDEAMAAAARVVRGLGARG